VERVGHSGEGGVVKGGVLVVWVEFTRHPVEGRGADSEGLLGW
jgi:hypothetical protein